MSVATQVKLLLSQYDVSRFFKKVTPAFEVDAVEKTNFASGTNKEFASGLKGGMVTGEAFWEKTAPAAAAGSDEILHTAFNSGTMRLITLGRLGLSLGSRVSMFETNETKCEINSDLGQMIMIAAEMQATGGVDSGICLHDLTAEGVTAGTNGASVNNGAATTNGGVAHLHYTDSVAGSGGAAVKIQHSTNEILWVDLVTFTALSSTLYSSQRVEVPAGTTINQFLRATWVVSGSGVTFTFAVTFARR